MIMPEYSLSHGDDHEEGFVSVLKYRAAWLGGCYDALVAVSRLGRMIKREVLSLVDLSGSLRIVDIGCGTGMLMHEAGKLYAGIEMIGIDPDPEMLRRAKHRTSQLKNRISLVRGSSTRIDLPDQSVDVCFSTLTFHHLSRVRKQKTTVEAHRILKNGGKLVIADFRRIRFPFLSKFFLFENQEYLRENFEGVVSDVIKQAGFLMIREIRRPFSLVSIIIAEKH